VSIDPTRRSLPTDIQASPGDDGLAKYTLLHQKPLKQPVPATSIYVGSANETSDVDDPIPALCFFIINGKKTLFTSHSREEGLN
jgi:hypothetical protein